MGKSPLRTVLRNFLDHYEKLEESLRQTRQTVKEMAGSGRSTPPPLSLYAQEFLKLKELTESLKNDSNCPMVEGHSEVNKKKNRYKDILPYDNSRVILSEYPGVPGSDYINANYVRGSSGNQRAYIASQGPLPNTLVDFWRMIWETEVLVIVMACNEREAGKYKCEPYWPLNTEEKQQYGNITVEHVKWRQVCPDFLVRTFKVSADNEERTICQFHYTTWPDHGVPSSVQPILELVRLMRDVQSSESRPILVHCSAGCGRTGTLCSIDYVWALLRTGKLREDFSLHEIISDMRRQRIAMVQTVEQYMLCYKAVATLFEQHLKLIDSHTYENVDDDGEPLGNKEQQQQQNNSSSINDNNKHERTSSESSTSSSSSDSSTESNKQDIEFERLISSNQESELQETQMENENDQKSESSDSDDSEGKEKTITTATDLISSDCCGEPSQQPPPPAPHEKLIGKATVIRRPSIAKLKAIFDNVDNQPSTSRPASTSQSNNRTSQRLQRSQSIKENFRNFNFNFHLEINQQPATTTTTAPAKLPPSNNKKMVKSYTLSAAKLSVYKKNVSFANLVANNKQSSNSTGRTKVMDIWPGIEASSSSASNSNNQLDDQMSNTDDTGRPDSSTEDVQMIESSSSSNHDLTNSTTKTSANALTTTYPSVMISASNNNDKNDNHNNDRFRHNRPASSMHPMSESSGGNSSSVCGAPPKPPRTYQHIMDDSCIFKTSEGRLIVTVAQPRMLQHKMTDAQAMNNSVVVDSGPHYIDHHLHHHQHRQQQDSINIYEHLPMANRKYSHYHQSSPNLANLAAGTFFSAAASATQQGPCPAFHMAAQPLKSTNNYCDNSNANGIYGNPAALYPVPVYAAKPLHPSQYAGSTSIYENTSSPYIDFQNHQAKPIILQAPPHPPQHYEPIYGRATFVNNHQQPKLQNCSNVLLQQHHQQIGAAPIRSKSIPSRIVATGHHHQIHDSSAIYSNRDICYNDHSSTVPPTPLHHHQMRAAAKENIYTEIQIKPNQTTTANHQTSNNKDQTANAANNLQKSGRFNKFCKALKIGFRFKGGVSSPATTSGSSSKTSIPKSNHAAAMNIAHHHQQQQLRNTTGSTAEVKPQTNSNSVGHGHGHGLKIASASNGTSSAVGPINPLNGQPLSRPPHSHRFQNATQTQWTQV